MIDPETSEAEQPENPDRRPLLEGLAIGLGIAAAGAPGRGHGARALAGRDRLARYRCGAQGQYRHGRRDLCGEPQLQQSLRQFSGAGAAALGRAEGTFSPARPRRPRAGDAAEDLGGHGARGAGGRAPQVPHRAGRSAGLSPTPLRAQDAGGRSAAAWAGDARSRPFLLQHTSCRSTAAAMTVSSPGATAARWSWAIMATDRPICACGRSRANSRCATISCMGAFGGSVPEPSISRRRPAALTVLMLRDKSPAGDRITVLEDASPRGDRPKLRPDTPASAMDGPLNFVPNTLTPDFRR